MAVASVLQMTSEQRKGEHDDMQRKRQEFDDALEELRRAKARLEAATDKYLERLEGVKRNG